MAAEGLPPLADHERAELGQRPLSPIDYQAISYYSAPKKKRPKSLDEVDPELLETFDKLGIPLEEQERLVRRCGGCGI